MGRTQLSRLLRAAAGVLMRSVPVLLALADALPARPPTHKPPQ
jgi:hypothetical protein